MSKKKNLFTEEEIKSFSNLGEVLLRIHKRLVVEGKVKVNKKGKVIFIKDK